MSPGGLWMFCAVFMLLFLFKYVMNSLQYQETLQGNLQSFRSTLFNLPFISFFALIITE